MVDSVIRGQLGGEVEISATEERGTVVRMTVPVSIEVSEKGEVILSSLAMEGVA